MDFKIKIQKIQIQKAAQTLKQKSSNLKYIFYIYVYVYFCAFYFLHFF